MRFLNDSPPHTVVLCPAPDQLSLLIRIGTGIVSSSYALRMDIFARKGFFGKMRDKRFNGYDGVLRLLGFDVDMNIRWQTDTIPDKWLNTDMIQIFTQFLRRLKQVLTASAGISVK